MSKAEMSRLRIAANEAVNELDARIDNATGTKRSALIAQRQKAEDLESEAYAKEQAEILNPTEAGAGAKLTQAADKLEAEVARMKQGTENLQSLAKAIKAGTDIVKKFKEVAG